MFGEQFCEVQGPREEVGTESTMSRSVGKLRYPKIRLLQGPSGFLGLAVGTQKDPVCCLLV